MGGGPEGGEASGTGVHPSWVATQDLISFAEAGSAQELISFAEASGAASAQELVSFAEASGAASAQEHAEQEEPHGQELFSRDNVCIFPSAATRINGRLRLCELRGELILSWSPASSSATGPSDSSLYAIPRLSLEVTTPSTMENESYYFPHLMLSLPALFLHNTLPSTNPSLPGRLLDRAPHPAHFVGLQPHPGRSSVRCGSASPALYERRERSFLRVALRERAAGARSSRGRFSWMEQLQRGIVDQP